MDTSARIGQEFLTSADRVFGTGRLRAAAAQFERVRGRVDMCCVGVELVLSVWVGGVDATGKPELVLLLII